jgi:ABC-type multidrug transport system permease subunit
MTTLHSVASHGRVVIASLHQPSGDMLLGLDQVILMGHGRMLFMGPPKLAAGVFAAKGLPCPANSAIAEHMLNVASSPRDVQQLLLTDTSNDGSGNGDGATKAAGKVAAESPGTNSDESVDAWVPSINGNVVTKRTISTSSAMTNGSTGTTTNTAAVKAFAKPGFWRQLTVLFWRTLIDIWRNPILLRLHFFMSAFMGIVMGLVFWNVDDTNTGVQNRLGGTFFALAFLGFTSLTTVDLLMNERGVVMREVRGGYYSPITYMLSKVALDGLLLRCIPALVYWAPFYYMAGFRYESAYAAAWLFILVAFNCVVGAMSMCVTVASSTAGQASFIMNFLLLFSVVFTGFLVNISSIPEWIRWLHYLSVFYYAFEAMVMTEILGGSYDFEASSIGAAVKGVKGSVYLSDVLGLNTGNATQDIGILVAYWAGFILLALLIFMLRLPRTSDGTTSGWRKVLGKLKCW